MGSIHLLFLSSANPERLRIRQVNVMKHRFQLLTISTRRLATIERPRIPESCGSDGAEPSRCRSETCLTLWNVPWLGGPPVEQLTGPWRIPSPRHSVRRTVSLYTSHFLKLTSATTIAVQVQHSPSTWCCPTCTSP